MRILIYYNRKKDPSEYCLNKLKNAFIDNGVPFDVVEGDNQPPCVDYAAIFVIGGDGTLLRRTEFANKSSIPLIGINAGKLGFLTEFERSEIDDAVRFFLNSQLIRDKRETLIAEFNGERFYALNDIVIQRVYMDSRGATVTVNIYIDGCGIDSVRGDGVIVATPTGSTAYSLSAGGAILAPGINAFSVTPLSAHSFNLRPFVYSADSECVLKLTGGQSGGIMADGKLVATINQGESVKIFKAPQQTVFLRRNSFNFFDRLSKKLKYKTGERYD